MIVGEYKKKVFARMAGLGPCVVWSVVGGKPLILPIEAVCHGVAGGMLQAIQA